ncbi:MULTISPECIES: enoyl-CoA hydratase/isomerase family protein [Streptococcus]|jgi:3-hydroxybutyryl-coA dehydratase|uniref:3-hydroxybutyryl-CoA dehydratase n=1 Tax=Streptococcus infantis SK1076 TaxID=1005705 RepID=F5W074_9STRE|nr:MULTISPECIES: enoyl-CoA hydratase-related protein [Streptococcus]EGV03329.1 3-hydroxybutyryl-CoA dehydratase [Streptococcus infantis SK970]MBF1743528.1 enoyl-CoA hydratase/isomerase family protein [Streptococcus sp.]EGL86711.1 3-hydroxybutyryl-CoA dehydratase [Streptococcus infantis SK1076]MCP9057192.1 enoyl-CoA hydratase-related protein [Streptococcus infantis]MCP9081488.1 enoyl-CoA hydratase-related protein [Streptococcus infantis]
MSNTVLLEVKDGIGYITINRPAALNALSSEVLTDLNLVLDEVEKHEDIRVVIVSGQGDKAFVAGADIKEMDQMSPIQAFEYMTYANDTFTRLSDLTQPTIAVLNGYALGGGLELALSTDIRIGFEKTMVGFPEVGLGIIPGFAGTQRMSRLIGTSKTKELIYTARIVKGNEAYDLGILNKLVPAEELLSSAEELAKSIMKNAPLAVEKAKHVIQVGSELPLKNAIRLETEAEALLFSTEDKVEGMRAFVEKRKAVFNRK